MIPPLFKHQEEAKAFISKNGGSGCIFHEVGLGKTRTALECFDYNQQIVNHHARLRLLVVCPISLIEGAWIEDIKKYFPKFTFANLNKIFKKNDPVPSVDIYLINYESFVSEKNVDRIKTLTRTGLWMAVLDESSKIKNHSAKCTKVLLALRVWFRFRIVMSGTPAPNSEAEYWSQVLFVKDGIVNPKFNPFRSYYFHLARGEGAHKQIIQGKIYSREQAREIHSKGFKYEITPAMRTALMERIKPVCHFARKIDCLDLPEKTDEIRLVEMTDEQRRAYVEMKNHYITEIQGSAVTAEVALTKIMKLRQITGGFAIAEEKKSINIGTKNPKLEELQNVLEEAGRQPVIIWAVFQHEIKSILSVLGTSAVDLYGETKDKDGNVRAFREGKAQYLVAHPRSAGHGLTFVNSSLEVFYSLDYSWEYYEQARGRIHRPGQRNVCTYVHLLAKDSIDVEILKILQEKKHATDIVYKYIHG